MSAFKASIEGMPAAASPFSDEDQGHIPKPTLPSPEPNITHPRQPATSSASTLPVTGNMSSSCPCLECWSHLSYPGETTVPEDINAPRDADDASTLSENLNTNSQPSLQPGYSVTKCSSCGRVSYSYHICRGCNEELMNMNDCRVVSFGLVYWHFSCFGCLFCRAPIKLAIPDNENAPINVVDVPVCGQCTKSIEHDAMETALAAAEAASSSPPSTTPSTSAPATAPATPMTSPPSARPQRPGRTKSTSPRLPTTPTRLMNRSTASSGSYSAPATPAAHDPATTLAAAATVDAALRAADASSAYARQCARNGVHFCNSNTGGGDGPLENYDDDFDLDDGSQFDGSSLLVSSTKGPSTRKTLLRGSSTATLSPVSRPAPFNIKAPFVHHPASSLLLKPGSSPSITTPTTRHRTFLPAQLSSNPVALAPEAYPRILSSLFPSPLSLSPTTPSPSASTAPLSALLTPSSLLDRSPAGKVAVSEEEDTLAPSKLSGLRRRRSQSDPSHVRVAGFMAGWDAAAAVVMRMITGSALVEE